MVPWIITEVLLYATISVYTNDLSSPFPVSLRLLILSPLLLRLIIQVMLLLSLLANAEVNNFMYRARNIMGLTLTFCW